MPFLGLRNSGFSVPTDIQRESIGFGLRGCDVLGAAMTGSGKTLAFLIPVSNNPSNFSFKNVAFL